MKKRNFLAILTVVLVSTNSSIYINNKYKALESKHVLAASVKRKDKTCSIEIKDKYALMQSYIDYKKIEKEYLDKVAKREIEIIEINKRNERKNNVVFDPYNLLNISNITVDELIEIFEIKEKPYMIELCNAFIDAEQTYGVNAIFLAGLVAQESWWAEIPAGDGDNVTGMGVFNPGYKGFSYGGSKYRNIMATAEQIKNNYLTEDGEFYNGLSTYAVNVRYCLKPYSDETDYEWGDNINDISLDLEYIYHTEVKQLEDIPEEIPYPEQLKNKPFTEWEEENIWKLIS